jgi:L-ascorbate metabolism protein UlaG (beta-lactamase superfamily)
MGTKSTGGDTGLFGDMRLIGEEGLDLAVIPIGDNYTMGPGDALRAVKMLQPSTWSHSLQHL